MFITDETVTNLKQVTQFVPNLDYIDLASLLHAVADAIRQGQTLSKTLEELGVDIPGLTDGGYGLLPTFYNVLEEQELIALAGSCASHLMHTYYFR
ncbi:hypothetical protein [Brasilonema bromeliae]|uniref:Uncharacterized protein n=1 Tax=Brasilonema bromeliae SPC951 TaxID=385972 RepID=A0ABX1P8K5_9CYAN|nr:hypothetical protein [Brasilonema bromeliae]NMG20710.1 hypothetical protein [Brasilonema bromeliae SPC951]